MSKYLSLVFILFFSSIFGFNHNLLATETTTNTSPKPYAGEFIAIWETSNISSGSSLANEITIPTHPLYTYNYTVDWGDGSQDTNVTGPITHAYALEGSYTVMISGDFPAIYFNDSGDRLKIIEILDWGVIAWQTMEDAFHGCENLNFDAIAAPDLSGVTSLRNMFSGCDSFNGIVNAWDISTITDISGIFNDCTIFNRPLDNWNTSNVTDMSRTLRNCTSFNEPLDNWDTSSVTNMSELFYANVIFNQNISNWQVDAVTDMSGMFVACRRFNQPLNTWNVANVTNMNLTFFRTNDFDQDLSSWDVSNVTDMTRMFDDSGFNHPIDNWDVSSVTTMYGMFSNTYNFNQPLNSWDVSNVTNMYQLFFNARAFDQPLNNWNVGNVTTMASMFGAYSINGVIFNQDISSWNVANVTNLEGMFESNAFFNQPIGSWNVAGVTNFSKMFSNADAFNQPLNNWDLSSAINLSSMFANNDAFNQPINNWNLNSVQNISSLFYNASVFNNPLDNWDTSNITNMVGAFFTASSFNQNLASWNISNVTAMTNMLANSGISQENYDNIIIGWAAQTVQPNINLGANTLQYCDALSARQNLIDNSGWTFTGDSVNCSYVLCTEITSPKASDTQVPANSDIRWAPAPNATGYRVSIRRENGATNQVIYNNEDVGNVVGIDFTNEFTPGDTVYVTVVPYNDDGPATGCAEMNFTVIESWVNSPDAFKLTYDTTVTSTSTTAANQLKIEANTGYPDYLTYDYAIDWGDGQYDNNVRGNITHTYLNPGVYTVAIIGDYPSPYHYYSNSDAIKLQSIDQWGTQQWQSLERAFYGCTNMTYNATDIPDLSQVTNMYSTFSGCSSFDGNMNNWDVSNVTNFSYFLVAATSYNQPMNNWDMSNAEDLSGMFVSANSFDQPLDNWDVSNVVYMQRMFENAAVFNQPLDSWDVSNVTNMAGMFQRAAAFNQPLNSWNVSNVTDMSEMFNGFVTNMSFNQPLDNWDVAAVTNMSEMFKQCIDFNQNINIWDVSSVTDMSAMFQNATAYNQPLDNWDVSAVTTTYMMFGSASSFNQNINSWNVTNVINSAYMFYNATSFDQPLNSWDVNSVVNMSSMFERATVFNQPLANWDVSAVANMSRMFNTATVFNQPINSWNVSSVTLMPSMFEAAEAFNQELNNWDVAVVTNFSNMFKNAIVFNQPLQNWDTGEALDVSEMFHGATVFNQDINAWNVTYVTTMEEMFKDANAFNQSLDSWNVASVSNMHSMFQNATNFDGMLESWNVRGVTTMQDMFNGATSFNQSLNNWRVNGVSNMDGMFQNATSLDQSFDQWIIGTTSMRNMFHDATSLNQYLGDWDISNVINVQGMLDDTALSRENYDNTLIAWSELNVTPGLTLGAANLLYCDAVEERQAIIDTYGWSFAADVLDCPIPECTVLNAPVNGETDVPVNTNLSWEPTLYAREYQLTIRIEPAGTIINETVVNNTTYDFAADFSGGETVYVTIVPANENGTAVGPCTEESFVISSDPATVPDCTTLTLPANGATDISVTTDMEWNAISNADGYRITAGTSSGAADIANNIDVGNVTSFDFATDLPENTEIFVLITPYNAEGDATACTEASFTTEYIPVPPACTTLVSPTNGSTSVALDTNLSWNAIAEATGYLISIGTTSGGIEVANSIDVGNVTTYSLTEDLLPNRMYYVTIIPYNAVGDATGCSEESFRTGNGTATIPNCTNLSSPANGASDVSVSTDITWNAIGDADGYYLTVGTTPGGNDILNNEDVLATNTYNLAADLPENTTFYVSITPYNAVGSATSCTEESFTTETLPTAPPCTTVTLPTNGATEVAVSTNIFWDEIANADGYYLTIGTTTGGNDILNNEDVVGTNSYNLAADLPENTQIFVTAVPYNSVGTATSCTEISFTTETLPTVPLCTSLTTPINGATEVSVSTSLQWTTINNADGYYVTAGTSSGANDILDNEDVVGTNTFDLLTDLPEATEIFVTIIAYNGIGIATGCSETSFTTETMPTAPECTALSTPINGATAVDVNTQIAWSTIANADGYYLSIGTSSGSGDILDNEGIVGTNTYNLASDLPEDTQIFVTVIPYNGQGMASGCTEDAFTTATVLSLPNCVALTSPTSEAIEVAVDTALEWNPVPDADGYRISIGTSTGGNNIADQIDVGILTNYTPDTALPNNTTIYVSITPYNTDGEAIGCQEQYFTTEEVLDETAYGISPNGDGINDFWVIDGIENHPDNVVSIYNRWGDLVWEIHGYDNYSRVFNGEANKKTGFGASSLPSGTYFFNIQVSEPNNLNKLRGYLVLKR